MVTWKTVWISHLQKFIAAKMLCKVWTVIPERECCASKATGQLYYQWGILYPIHSIVGYFLLTRLSNLLISKLITVDLIILYQSLSCSMGYSPKLPWKLVKRNDGNLLVKMSVSWYMVTRTAPICTFSQTKCMSNVCLYMLYSFMLNRIRRRAVADLLWGMGCHVIQVKFIT